MSERSAAIGSRRSKIVLSHGGKDGISSLRNLSTAQELCSAVGRREGLYVLELQGEHGTSTTLSSRDAGTCSIHRTSGESGEILALDFTEHGELDIDVHCNVRIEAESGLSRWRIEVENRSDLTLVSLRYPVIVAPTPLNGKNERQDEYLLVPFLDNGVLFKNPSDTIAQGEPPHFGPWGWRSLYPGMACAQMMAFYDDRGGLYVATEDWQGYCKRFHPIRLYEGVDMSVEHFPGQRPARASLLRMKPFWAYLRETGTPRRIYTRPGLVGRRCALVVLTNARTSRSGTGKLPCSRTIERGAKPTLLRAWLPTRSAIRQARSRPWCIGTQTD